MTLELTQGNEHASSRGLVVCQNPGMLGWQTQTRLRLAQYQALIMLGMMLAKHNHDFLGGVTSPDTRWTQTRLVLVVCQLLRTLG